MLSAREFFLFCEKMGPFFLGGGGGEIPPLGPPGVNLV
jgi:hypothetical protein